MRVALRKHPNGRARVAAVDVPTFCGAIRVTGVGDVFSDALGRAVKIASRIVDDPLVRAIMPPQGVIAIDALRDIAGASQMGPDALSEVLTMYSGPGQRRLIQTLAKEQTAPTGTAAPSGDNIYRGVGPAPTSRGRGLGAMPPVASGGHGGVTVTNSNPQGGRIPTPKQGQPGYASRDKGLATDQRTTPPEGFIPGKGWIDDRYRLAYEASLHISDDPAYPGGWKGSAAIDRLNANVDKSQGATDADLWHKGDFMPPPTPGRAMSEDYYQTLLSEAAVPGNPYAADPQYAEFYAQLQADNPDAFADPGATDGYDPYAYDPYGGGGYAYPDNNYYAPQYPYGSSAEDDIGQRWDSEQAQAKYLDALVEES